MLFGSTTMTVTDDTRTNQQTIRNIGVSYYNYGYVFDTTGNKIADLRNNYGYSEWLKWYVNEVIIPTKLQAEAIIDTSPTDQQPIIDYCNTFISVSDSAYGLLVAGATMASIFGTTALSLTAWWTLDSKKLSLKKK